MNPIRMAIATVWLAGSVLAQDMPGVRTSSFNVGDVQIRGGIQAQFGYVQAENDQIDERWSTFEVRRVRLGLRGTLAQEVRAQIDADLIPGASLSMRSAFLEWREYEKAFVKVGYDKPRFGFEETTSSSALLTVERSLIGNTLAPGPMSGLSMTGKSGLLAYGAGVYSDQANRNPDHLPARYLSNLSAELILDVWVGQTLRLRADYLDSADATGRFGAGYTRAFSASLHFSAGPFDLRTEVLTGDARNGGDAVSGFYAMPSWRFTERWQGVLRFEKASADAAEGLQAPDRYVRRVPGLETAGDAADPSRGDAYSALYAGVTYYMAGHHHKLMFGIERSELDTVAAGTLRAVSLYGAWRMLF